MAEDVPELIPWVLPGIIRLCPIHRIAFDADSTQYVDAGRCCPAGGERLLGFLDRFRDEQATLPADFLQPEHSWP